MAVEPTIKAPTAPRRMLTAGLVVIAFTLLAKSGQAVRDLLVASHFGTGDTADAYFVAIAAPLFVLNLVIGAVPAALMPPVVRAQHEEGGARADQLVSSVLGPTLAILGIATAALALAGPLLIRLLGPGLTPSTQGLALRLFYALLPLVAIGGATAITSTLLNADSRFGRAAAAQAVNQLIAIAVLILLTDAWGVTALVVGVVAGYAIEAVLVARWARALGWTLRPQFERPLPPPARSVMLQYIPMAGAAFLTGTNVLVDQSVASTVGAGNVAVLGYATRIISVVLQVSIFAVSSVLLSHFSHLFATRARSAWRTALWRQSLAAGAVGLAVTVLLVLLSHPLVRIVFQRGSFSKADADLVGTVQSLYALQLVPHMIGIVWVRFLSAVGSNRPIMVISGVNLVANVALDLALVGPLGVKGIALSTSIVYAGSAVMLWVTVRRRLAEP